MKEYRVYAEIEILGSKCEVEVFVEANSDEEAEKKAIDEILSNINVDVTNIIDDEDDY